jgi:methyl-accepting chemotaxis protein
MNYLIELLQKVKLQLRWKLLGGFLLANLFLFLALGVCLLTLFNTSDTLQRVQSSKDRSQVVDQMQVWQAQLATSALDYVWSNKLARRGEHEIAQTNLQRAVDNFQPNPLQAENYQQLKKEVANLNEILEQMVALNEAGHADDAKYIWQTQGSKQMVRTQSVLQELNQQESHSALVDYEQANQQVNSVAYYVTVLAGLALVLALSWTFLLTAALIGPVSQLRRRLANLARGDLTQPVQVVSGDELGELGQTYNLTLNALQSLIKQLHFQSQQVSVSIEELTYQTSSQVAGSSQQAGAITEATKALQELNLSAGEIASQTIAASKAVDYSLGRAQAVSQLAEEMVQAHQQGRTTVAQTIGEVQSLKDQIQGIEAEQQRLVEQSTAIQSINGLIDTIARETHLLALNAAIEAAGAGQQGERFAVVAAEVKSLAERSVKATKEVRVALNSIAATVAQVYQLTEQGLAKASQAVAEAEQSDKVLIELAYLSEKVKEAVSDIVVEVKSSSQLTSSIGAATRQQQVSSIQVLDKMLEIESVTAQNLSSIKQVESVSQQLNSTALELKQSADTFKLVSA